MAPGVSARPVEGFGGVDDIDPRGRLGAVLLFLRYF
jgi:hypothetical protein